VAPRVSAGTDDVVGVGVAPGGSSVRGNAATDSTGEDVSFGANTGVMPTGVDAVAGERDGTCDAVSVSTLVVCKRSISELHKQPLDWYVLHSCCSRSAHRTCAVVATSVPSIVINFVMRHEIKQTFIVGRTKGELLPHLLGGKHVLKLCHHSDDEREQRKDRG